MIVARKQYPAQNAYARTRNTCYKDPGAYTETVVIPFVCDPFAIQILQRRMVFDKTPSIHNILPISRMFFIRSNPWLFSLTDIKEKTSLDSIHPRYSCKNNNRLVPFVEVCLQKV